MAIPLDPISAVLGIGSQLIDRLWPDAASRDAAKLELLRLQQTGELANLQAGVAIAAGQTDTNKVEAASDRLFVAGWRPFVGWICAASFGFKFIGGPLLAMGMQMAGVHVELPTIDTAELLPLLFGMLGLGGMRTIEKLRGVA